MSAARSPIDELVTVAGICALGDRTVLPKELCEQLEAAIDAVRLPDDGEGLPALELLTVSGEAVLAYRDLPQALTALRAAYALVNLLRSSDPAPPPATWERNAGLIG